MAVVIAGLKSKPHLMQISILRNGKKKLGNVTHFSMQMEGLMSPLFPHINVDPNQTFLTSQREWYTVTKKAVTDVTF